MRHPAPALTTPTPALDGGPAPATPDNGYTWPQCTACHRDLWADETGRRTCRICQAKAATHLATIGALFPRLNTTTALLPAVRRSTSTPNPQHGAAPGGRTTAPVPFNLHALNLTAPGGVATRLQAIEDSWRNALGWTLLPHTDGKRVFPSWRTRPATAVPRHLAFLTNNLPWACDAYDSVDQDLDDLRRLAAECTAVLDPTPRGRRIDAGTCPTTPDEATEPCGTPLTATTDDHTVRCHTCGTRWDGLAAWRDLRLAQEALTARQPVAA